jgi:hypothetical protein
MVANIEAERRRIRGILAPGAKMNPKLADALAYDSSVTSSVAVNVLAQSLKKALATLPGGVGTLPTDPVARELVLACRWLRALTLACNTICTTCNTRRKDVILISLRLFPSNV